MNYRSAENRDSFADVAVALFVYRRPAAARLALASIRRRRPARFYLVADAPKEAAEVENCTSSRRLIEEIDWECEVRSNFATKHLGCAKRIATGVSWVFETETSAIFLEEDCIADESFFPFCEELLERFAMTEQVMTITGFNLLSTWRSFASSYCFSFLGSSWGWATWRRAWDYFDSTMVRWNTPATRNRLRSLLGDDEVFDERARLFDKIVEHGLDSWAIPWNLSCLLRGGCCAVPSVNLIKNIGFGPDSAHHKSQEDPNSGVPLLSMSFPLCHPPQVRVDRELDRRWNRKSIGRADWANTLHAAEVIPPTAARSFGIHRSV